MTVKSRPLRIGRPLMRVEVATSTMDLARDLATLGADPGTAVVAGYQSHGRGRSNRRWETSPWSAILLSFLTSSRHSPESLGLLSLVWALAVAETVEAFSAPDARIKWPNDVLVGGKKISGILMTNSMLSGNRTYTQVTGIGLNCRSGPEGLPEGATSLRQASGRDIRYDDVLSALLDRLSGAFAVFEEGKIKQLVSSLHARLAFTGEMVQIHDGDRVIQGEVEGLLPSGALVLRQSTGEATAVVAGELTRGPRIIG